MENNLKNSEMTKTPANGFFTMLINSQYKKKTLAGVFVILSNFNNFSQFLLIKKWEFSEPFIILNYYYVKKHLAVI